MTHDSPVISNEYTGETPVVRRWRIPELVLAAASGILIAAASWLCAGNSLGVFLGPVLLLPLILCPLVLREPRVIAILQCCLAALVISAAWLIVCLQSGIPFRNWLGCTLILLSFSLAVGMLARLVRVSSVVVLIALAWLTWPVWLSPALMTLHGSRWVDGLVAAHPLFAINGLVQSLGIWSEQPIAYRLTHLGQDLRYSLPTPTLAIVIHSVIALAAAIFPRPPKTPPVVVE